MRVEDITPQMMAAIEARRGTREANAAPRMAAIQSAMTSEWKAQLNADLLAMLSAPIGLKEKMKRLYELMERVNVVRAPHVACKAGCDACCHVQIEITQVEADIVAEAVGRVALQLPAGRHTTPVDQFARSDTPCPFLDNHQCTVYAHRPFICRELVVADIDALTCGFENSALCNAGDPRTVMVSQVTTPPLRKAHELLRLSQPQAMADMRQFFPDSSACGQSAE